MRRRNSKKDLFPRVTSVEHLGGHRLRIMFVDGKGGVVDFRPYIARGGEMFKPLQREAFFKQVRLVPEGGTIEWPNGVDWCPDVLYWLVTGTPIPWATDAKYHEPPPHT